ncbi:MAG: hypothetical protein C5617_005930 [ANME-2 cluster archaeon]|jgi:hypothetical protein|nr:MAG: hypothetical protein C5617_005930 [ANME-2 cluster archaeon]
MNKITLLTIAMVSLALFVLPNTISMFVGQHTFEAGVQCQKCHVAEYCELDEATTIDVHKRAANNMNYTTFLSVGGIKYYPSNSTISTINNNKWIWNGAWDGGNGTWENGSEHKLVSLDFNGDGEIDGAELCHLCHNASLFGIEGGHAVTVRVCDDDRCHGNRNHSYLGDAADLFANPANVTYVVTAGYNLSRGNVHQSFYLNLSNQSSTYPAGYPFGHASGNAYGIALSRGHWTCIACHSDVGTDVTLNPHPVYNHSDADAPQRRYW